MQPVTKIRIFRIRLAVAILAVYWLAMFTGTHWPRMDFVGLPLGDKVKHFGGFFGLTLLLCYVSGGKRITTRFFRVALIVMSYGLLDEWSQGFVPGRTPDRMDFLADTAGMITAMTFYLLGRVFLREPFDAVVGWIRGDRGRTGELS